jgi:hypothetical protein
MMRRRSLRRSCASWSLVRQTEDRLTSCAGKRHQLLTQPPQLIAQFGRPGSPEHDHRIGGMDDRPRATVTDATVPAVGGGRL